jgi:hypothetical protein
MANFSVLLMTGHHHFVLQFDFFSMCIHTNITHAYCLDDYRPHERSLFQRIYCHVIFFGIEAFTATIHADQQ